VFGIGKPKNREEHRYYLLPGMGKANRRKHSLYLRWAVVVGLIISIVIGIIIYFAQRPGPSAW
jgi:heme/copper-type cytochrome/quinol oxidase subunit 2